MKKKHKSSYIMKMHIESSFARELLGERNPRAYGEPVVVTQVESVGDKYIVCEIMPKEEYERMVEVPAKRSIKMGTPPPKKDQEENKCK